MSNHLHRLFAAPPGAAFALLLLALAGMVIALTGRGPAQAQPVDERNSGAAAPDRIERRELWVPIEHLKAVLAKHPRAVMLSGSQYEALMRDALKSEDKKPQAAPVAAVVESATLDGRLLEDVVQVTGRYRVRSLTEGWAEVPLALPVQHLASIEVDGLAAVRAIGKGAEDGPARLLVKGEGEHEISAEFHLPVNRTASGNVVSIPSPGVVAASLDLVTPQGVKLESALPFQVSPVEGEQAGPASALRARFVLPKDHQTFEIRWAAEDVAEIPGAAILQNCRYLYALNSTRIQADLGLVLNSSLRDLPETITIDLPPAAQVLSVEGSEVLRWTKEGDAVTVGFEPGRRKVADVRVLVEVPVMEGPGGPGSDIEMELPVPDIRGVHRSSGTLTLIGSDDIRVKNIETGALTVPAQDEIDAMLRDDPFFVAGFSFPVATQPPRVTLSPVLDRFNVQLDTEIRLNRESIETIRHVSVLPLEGRIFENRIIIPNGEDVIRVTQADGGEPDWVRMANEIRLRWKDGLGPGEQRQVKIQTRRDPANWYNLGVEPVTLTFTQAEVEGAEAVSGYVAVTYDASFRVETGATTGLEPRDGRHTPVRGALAWFRLNEYQMELSVSRRPAEFDVYQVGYVLPVLDSTEIEGQIGLAIRYSPIQSLTVKLPPDVASNFRVDSPLVAERRLNAETGEWTLTFHQELMGQQLLRYRLVIPFASRTEGEAVEAEGDAGKEARETKFTVNLPAISLPDARRVEGHWIIEANSDTELTFESEGLDEVDSLTVPSVTGYVARHRVIAAYRYRGDAYRLRLAGTRHVARDLATLVVDQLRINSVVSTGGLDRHEAAMTVRASGEQFIGLQLPEDARIWSLSVNGVAVKPVSAGEDQLRVPLPAGEAAGASVFIKLTYELDGKAWDGAGRQRLEPVRVAEDVPVLHTEWLLHLPEGFDYRAFQSNLSEEFEIVDRTLLGQVWETTGPGGYLDLGFDLGSRRELVSDRRYDDRNRVAMSEEAGVTRFRAVTEPAAAEEPMAPANAPNGPAVFGVGGVFTDPQSQAIPRGEAAEAMPEDKEPMLTRVFTVPPGFLPQTDESGQVVDPFAASSSATPSRPAPAPKEVLEAAGVNFPDGANATYDPETGQLIVRNTRDQLDLVDAFTEVLSPASESDRSVTFQREFQGGPNDLTGFDYNGIAPAAGFASADRDGLFLPRQTAEAISGLIPLEFTLPDSGQSYSFKGLYAPEAIEFRYVDWDRQVRWGWVWILVGAVAYVWLARRRPFFMGLAGVFILTFIPLIISRSLSAFCNSLLLGWGFAFGVWIVYAVSGWWTKKYGRNGEVVQGKEVTT